MSNGSTDSGTKKYGGALELLAAMGYTDSSLLVPLLQLHNGDANAVMNVLLG
jgi:hypothetical protein